VVADEAAPPSSLSVNYESGGSENGRDRYATGVLQSAVTDMPYTVDDGSFAPQGRSAHRFIYVPLSAAGLVVPYSIEIDGHPRTGLNLTSQDVSRIFTGQLTNWNELVRTLGDTILAGLLLRRITLALSMYASMSKTHGPIFPTLTRMR
jgi:ABC-type phosphate transport system substrate-binding protein